MKLLRLRVVQLRQFRQPLEIGDFAPGINVFWGPNESGKSTLVRAIRAAFFERHRSSSVDDLQPWGDSSAAPQILLEFECQGRHWRLEKTFLRQKRCDLQVGDQRFDGDEAEEELARLLGFQFPGRGASREEHWGIPGLLWIEQGAGQELRQAVVHAGGHLQTALGGSLGEVASSAGDAVIAAVERERAVLLTSTGRPTGEHARVIQQHGDLQNALDELDTKISGYRAQVDRLGELQRQQQLEAAEQPWEGYRAQARAAQRRLTEVEDWMTEQAREERELVGCRQNLDLVRQQLAAFAGQVDELRTREADRQRAVVVLDELREREPRIGSLHAEAQATYQQSREAVRRAREHERRESVQRELRALDRQLLDIEGNLAKGRGLQSELLALRDRLQVARIDPLELKRLQDLNRRMAELSIRQQAVATRLQFDLLPGQGLQLDDDALAGRGERLLLAAAQLEIPGVGQLRILPGGEDLPDLARDRQKVQDDLTALLAAMGVGSLAVAEERAELCRTLQADIDRATALLAACAPTGIEALAADRQLALSRRTDLAELLEDPPEEPDETLSVAVAEARLEAADQALKAALEELGLHRNRLMLAEQMLQNATAEWQRLRDALETPDRQQREQQAHRQLIDLRADQQRLEQSIALRTEQIDAARPDILRQDIQRFGDTADGLEKAHSLRALELKGLQSALETAGADGLEEQRAELALEFERLDRRLDELRRRAGALTLLLDLLKDQRQALTRRLQAPLQANLNHYLQLLFPQASLSVDEQLIPSGLTRSRGDAEERADFDALSFGAREQMGLISRLAYADLLKQAGRPTLIILDDALTHSDPERLAQMKRVLFDAAQRHQILLFTCHPDNWRDLGVAPRDVRANASHLAT